MVFSHYQVGGSLQKDNPTYVVRRADTQLYQSLIAGEFCYVFNSRQMGKSSLLVRAKHQLETEGYRCAAIDMTRLGSEHITPLQWYKGVLSELWLGFDCLKKINLKPWWREREELSFIQRLSLFISELLLEQFPQDKLIIFIDEIDSILSLPFPIDDFFALIRWCYNQRAIASEYKRLTFVLLGVATPADLIQDKNRTPFNIGRAIELHGFTLEEAQPLATGLEGIVKNPQIILKEILVWTAGQPFLTQKLCQLALWAVQYSEHDRLTPSPGTEAFWIENLVRSRIIEKWEFQDEPEHLKTIRDRLLRKEQATGRLLGIYQQILQGVEVLTDDSPEQIELLLSGLVVKEKGLLKVKNCIYQEVFNLEWVEKKLTDLRPYSQAFDNWVASKQEDESRLLRGEALKDAQNWARGKSLSDLDYQFLAKSEELDRIEVQQALEAARLKEVEVRLEQQKKAARRQRILLFAVSLALLLTCVFAGTTYLQYRQALKSEVKAIASASLGDFDSNRKLDALIEAISAKRKLLSLGSEDINLHRRVDNALRQAVYNLDEYNRLTGHKASVMAVAISSDSSLIASASVDNTIKIWRYDGSLLRTLTGHEAIVRAVNFSPDGNFIASGSDDGKIKLWQIDGSLLRTFHNGGGVWALAFSPDGQTIASAGADRTVKLWRYDGSLLRTFPRDTAGLYSVAFSPDGNTIASGSADKTVKLWNRDGTLLKTLEGHTNIVYSVAFSPDGQILASGSTDETVKLWKRDGSLVRTLQGHTAALTSIAFSPDGQMLASASRDKTVKLWNIDGTELKTLRGHSAIIWGVAWSPDGSFIASAGAENTIKLWQSQNPLQTTIYAHQAGIWGLDISSDSSFVATGGGDGLIKLWSRQGRPIETLTEERPVISAIAISPDGSLIASAKNQNIVELWNRDGTLRTTLVGHSGGVFTVAFSPDGQTLATGSLDNTIKLWKLDGTLLHTMTTYRAPVWQVAFSPNGQLLANGSGDGKVMLWKLDGSLLRTLKGHTASVSRVAFSPNGQMVANGSGDGTVKLWKLDGSLLRTFFGHTAGVWGLGFSPDSQLLASGSLDNTVKLWKLDGTELMTLRSHSAAVRGIAISPDGQFLASVGEDSTLILWNLSRILNLDVLAYGCDRARDYLRTNESLEKSDRLLCAKSTFSWH